ncbi:hypothetical protein [Parvibium lacunae]|uniref:Uncharacterized protein n=1 Tax=Parvibium lacunae TaxID=1888893 RepID=A0A368L4F7_9BURK|nr:hypothetical protein [Parvibium lacunae]RCS58040.1 hypothetical protein DU000_04140 [Parvibium lacunae]
MNAHRKPVVILERGNGIVDVDVPAVSGWDGFDKLFLFLKNEYQARAINTIDGPDARKWVIEIEGHSIKICHDDYGNSIHSLAEESADLVRRIGLDLEKRLANC